MALKLKTVKKDKSTGIYAYAMLSQAKTLIDFYEVSSLESFKDQMEHYMKYFPRKNASTLESSYRLALNAELKKVEIYKRPSSNKPDVLLYEITH